MLNELLTMCENIGKLLFNTVDDIGKRVTRLESQRQEDSNKLFELENETRQLRKEMLALQGTRNLDRHEAYICDDSPQPSNIAPLYERIMDQDLKHLSKGIRKVLSSRDIYPRQYEEYTFIRDIFMSSLELNIDCNVELVQQLLINQLGTDKKFSLTEEFVVEMTESINQFQDICRRMLISKPKCDLFFPKVGDQFNDSYHNVFYDSLHSGFIVDIIFPGILSEGRVVVKAWVITGSERDDSDSNTTADNNSDND